MPCEISSQAVIPFFHEQLDEEIGSGVHEIEITKPHAARSAWIHKIKFTPNANTVITSIKVEDNELLESALEAGEAVDWFTNTSLTDRVGCAPRFYQLVVTVSIDVEDGELTTTIRGVEAL